MTDFNKEALAIWDSLKPMIDKEIERKTAGMVQRRKMVISTAPSMQTGLIGVTEPFGSELFIPFVGNLASAAVGDSVWVEYAYGANNYVAMGKASLDDKDLYVAGDLTVNGDATFNGDAAFNGDVSGISASDVGAVPVSGSDGFLYRSSNAVSQKELCKSLWSGRWSSGTLQVDGLSNYTLFIIKIALKSDHEPYGTAILACRILADVNWFLRGMGGYASNTTANTTYYLAATISGDVLTWKYCYGHTSSGSNSQLEVIEIIGVI